MHHRESKTVRARRPQREVRRIPVGTRPDLAALVPALGLVPGVDSFVLLDGEGWGTGMLGFDPERVLSVDGDSPFEKLRSLLTLEEYPGGFVEGHQAAGPALFGYLSYDAARSLERIPNLAEDDLRLPVARFILPRYVIGAGPEGTWASVPVGHSTQTSYLRPSISRRCSQTRLLTRPRARFGPRAPPLGARGTCGQWSG
jgi:anthranilate/para-aminobenzoate synthase component I